MAIQCLWKAWKTIRSKQIHHRALSRESGSERVEWCPVFHKSSASHQCQGLSTLEYFLLLLYPVIEDTEEKFLSTDSQPPYICILHLANLGCWQSTWLQLEATRSCQGPHNPKLPSHKFCPCTASLIHRWHNLKLHFQSWTHQYRASHHSEVSQLLDQHKSLECQTEMTSWQ